MMGTGAKAQVLTMAISAPLKPMPPTIMAFMPTRNICSPKNAQQLTTSQRPNSRLPKVSRMLSPMRTRVCCAPCRSG